VRVVYSACYQLDLHGHIWPTEKYQRTDAALLERHLMTPRDVVEPIAVSWDQQQTRSRR
jgi:hypothetical protein